ncbi:MAG: hypothetical protein EOM01_09145 [Spirochaetia bacterium]|nr:hypothetical protein [Spirochaetia bacterium]
MTQEEQMLKEQMDIAQRIVDVTSQIDIPAVAQAIDAFSGQLFQILLTIHVDDPNSKSILAKCQGLNDFKLWLVERKSEAERFLIEHS